MSFIQRINEVYENSKVGSDSAVDRWLLMSSPVPVMAIVVAYASFVLYFGPKFMRNRQPFKIEWIIIAYNAIQVFYSGYIVRMSFDSSYFIQYFFGFGCTSVSPAEDAHFKEGLYRGAWLYVMAKVVDLLDTCFFVLRKKQSNISFLHVYHHIGTLLFSWSVLKYSMGQECLVIGLLNSFVHVIMYFYYFLAAFGPRFRKFLWWKKYLTVLQLAQFGYIFLHMMLALMFSCHWNRVVVYAVTINTLFHVYLFADFYQKAYRKKETADRKKQEINGNKID